jgi:hypothetical protein
MNTYVTSGQRRLRAFLATTSVAIALALVAGVTAMPLTAGGRGDRGRKAATTPRPHASKSPSVSPSLTSSAALAWTGRPSDKLRLKLRTVIGG